MPLLIRGIFTSKLFLSIAIGVLIGVVLSNFYYGNKARELIIDQYKAYQSSSNTINKLSKDYYELYKKASDSKPVTIVERVFVEGSCVQETTDPGVGNDRNASRVEIAERVVRNLTELAHSHKVSYEQCSAALRFHQEINRDN